MMGLKSVEYHREAVLERGDDMAEATKAYYDERGQAPMMWSGSGARSLGYRGQVTSSDYRQAFENGPGRRPGIEIVVSLDKTVAELGVIGRQADMWRIVNAEREATLGYLDRVVREQGGRRGRARAPVPTSGLVYSYVSHATSRAGDPMPHQHCLIANQVEMLDRQGGIKALDTALVRHRLSEATRAGQEASARVARQLGYGVIEPGDGSLRHWKLAGVPERVTAVHSKRAAQIEAALPEGASYRASRVVARATRSKKTGETVDDLMPRWLAELAAMGWTPEAILRSILLEAAKERTRKERDARLEGRGVEDAGEIYGRLKGDREAREAAPAVARPGGRERSRVAGR